MSNETFVVLLLSILAFVTVLAAWSSIRACSRGGTNARQPRPPPQPPPRMEDSDTLVVLQTHGRRIRYALMGRRWSVLWLLGKTSPPSSCGGGILLSTGNSISKVVPLTHAKRTNKNS